MSDRPTPEQLAQEADLGSEGRMNFAGGDELLTLLAAHGYVIVHPDDVPERAPNPNGLSIDFNIGWNDCRRHIFGDDR